MRRRGQRRLREHVLLPRAHVHVHLSNDERDVDGGDGRALGDAQIVETDDAQLRVDDGAEILVRAPTGGPVTALGWTVTTAGGATLPLHVRAAVANHGLKMVVDNDDVEALP